MHPLSAQPGCNFIVFIWLWHAPTASWLNIILYIRWKQVSNICGFKAKKGASRKSSPGWSNPGASSRLSLQIFYKATWTCLNHLLTLWGFGSCQRENGANCIQFGIRFKLSVALVCFWMSEVSSEMSFLFWPQKPRNKFCLVFILTTRLHTFTCHVIKKEL